MTLPHDPTFTIDEVISTSESVQLTVASTSQIDERRVEDLRLFSYSRYAQEIHPPVEVPHIDTSALNAVYPRCLDMPIRLSGDSAYTLPTEWQELAPLLESIISTEHAHNSSWRDYYTYITVDCKMVSPQEQQRHGGLHVDGFQGERIFPKTKVTRNYVVTTNGGTRFYPQRFVVADPKVFNVFQGFDLQAQNFLLAQTDTVYFMNAYTVHESGFATFEGLRTFLRVTYDLKKFDRLGNTHNSALNYSWDMVARNVHETVKTPRLSDVDNSPYA